MHHAKRHWLAAIVSAAWLVCAPALLWAAEEHGGGGLISIDKSLIIQVINFAILLLVLHRLLYKPLLAKMEERSGAIKKAVSVPCCPPVWPAVRRPNFSATNHPRA